MKNIDLYVGPLRACITPQGSTAACGLTQGQIERINDAALAIDKGRLVGVGTHKQLSKKFRGRDNIRAPDLTALPGFVDSHTHALFAKSRAWEYGRRLKGESYLEIAKAGGGILNSCRDLQRASTTQLTKNLKTVLQRMRAQGTTTVEVKSGYGLTLKSELRMLEIINKVARRHPMTLVPTFLGAHEVPTAYRGRRGAFVKLVIERWLPEVARKNLAEYCDVFCDVGVFSAADSKRILKAAQELGLKLKLHADEFEARGGTEVACKLGATSVDHLGALTAAGLRALKNSSTVATLLPGTCFTLDLKKWPPARRLIKAGIPVALATDCNPGSCMIESLPQIMSLACNKLKMTAEEAFVGVTLNGAAALDRADCLGTLEVGKLAQVGLWDIESIEEIPYHVNGNLCKQSIIGSDFQQ